MNCPNCSESLPAGAVFCPNCGARPESKPVAAAPAPPQASRARTFSGMNTIAPMREHRASVLEPGTVFAERYEVKRKLGEGGMGVVYVALDKHTGEELVLKLIHPDLVTGEEAVQRLKAEGLTARKISHPNIVRVHDVSEWNGQPYFSMEFVKGGTLRSWMINHISSRTDVKLETAAGIIRTMLKGLAEAHRMGVVHRDLKPENVLLAGDPDAGDFNLKILDFGIAKAVNAPRSGSGSGGAIGTPLYMAPEQMTSAEAVGPAADIYSLSVMFYELLMEASPQARWEPISRNRPDVPKAIDDLIEKGLSARPRSRYATVAEYEAALDAAMKAAAPAPAPPAPVSPDPVPPPPVRPDPPPPPPVRPDPPPAPPVDNGKDGNIWTGQFGSMSKKTRMWVGIAAAVLVIGVIGNMTDTGNEAGNDDVFDPGPGPVPGPEPAPEPAPGPEPGPAAPTYETWNLYPQPGMPFPFDIQRSGQRFLGRGMLPNGTAAEISGSLTGNGELVIATPAGVMYRGPARLVQGQGGMDVTSNNVWVFHINH